MTVVWREEIFKKLLDWFSNQERIIINSFNIQAMNIKNVKMSPLNAGKEVVTVHSSVHSEIWVFPLI